MPRRECQMASGYRGQRLRRGQRVMHLPTGVDFVISSIVKWTGPGSHRHNCVTLGGEAAGGVVVGYIGAKECALVRNLVR